MNRLARSALCVVLALSSSVHFQDSHAEAASGPRRIYVISPGFSPDSEEGRAFRLELRELGYSEGRDLSIDWWYGKGRYDGIPKAVAELTRRKPDIIVVESTAAALAAKRATTTIPIVLALVADPVGSGLVNSLARPGGNVTGLTNQTAELTTRRLSFVREAIPKAKRVAVLWNIDTPPHEKVLRDMEPAAKELQLELKPIQARNAEEVQSALSGLSRMNVDALIVLDAPVFASLGSTILQGATRARVPVVWAYGRLAREGVLIAYAAPVKELFRRAAGYVDRILKGASPATLPVEQPTRFELIINLRMAKSLGITIPQSLLLQADEVIE
jgi:putative ABC transport system substrate-binding protein